MGETIMNPSAGARFRAAVAAERPLQVVGCINAYTARLAERSGFRAIYVSGSGVAAASLGLPDLGISTLDDVLVDVRRISDITQLPLLVDADTGWWSAQHSTDGEVYDQVWCRRHPYRRPNRSQTLWAPAK